MRYAVVVSRLLLSTTDREQARTVSRAYKLGRGEKVIVLRREDDSGGEKGEVASVLGRASRAKKTTKKRELSKTPEEDIRPRPAMAKSKSGESSPSGKKRKTRR